MSNFVHIISPLLRPKARPDPADGGNLAPWRGAWMVLAASGAATLALAALLTACANPPAPANPGVVAAESTPLLSRGHRLYITECAACHRARDPRSYSRQRWDKVLPDMESRSRLSPQDSRALEAYISAQLTPPDQKK